MRRPTRVGALVVLALALGAPAQAANARRELTFQDPAITESSGLVSRGADVLTVNDSGDGPVIYVVDATSGQTVGHTTYTTDAVVDVEALAPGPRGSVWVGDIGDNDRSRDLVSIYRVPAVTREDRTVTAERFDLAYPKGARDAETLLVHPRTGQVLVVSKGLFGGQVFAAPRPLRTDEVNLLRPVADVGGLVTDGTFLPDGRHVVLRDYRDGAVYDAEAWKKRGSFPLPSQPQAEAVATRSDGRVLVSSEGERQPVFSVAVPARLLAEPASSGSSTGSDPPDRATPSRSEDPTVPILAGGAVLVLLTLVGFSVLRTRVRRGR